MLLEITHDNDEILKHFGSIFLLYDISFSFEVAILWAVEILQLWNNFFQSLIRSLIPNPISDLAKTDLTGRCRFENQSL